MKARIKATGEIVEVKSKVITSFTGEHRLKYIDQKTGISYFEEELFFPKDLADDPDYWTRLEHQYAGMAMQGILTDGWGSTYISNPKSKEQHLAIVTNAATEIAHALVEKMKNQSV